MRLDDSSSELLELARSGDWRDIRSDPRPGWSGPATLFGAPTAELGRLPAGTVAAAGIPFDGTASSRPGAAEGPQAIRAASLVLSRHLESLGEDTMVDLRTGATVDCRARAVVDCGDLHVYPSDVRRTYEAVSAEVRELAGAGRLPVLLGGDHSITLAGVAGVAAAGGSDLEGLGVVHVDHHFDFGDWSRIHGPIYHGSNSRRIAELPGMEPRNFLFVGVGGTTRRSQLGHLHERGFGIVTAGELRRDGPGGRLAALLGGLAERCTRVYLTLDIDVLDCSQAPGTGNVTVGGLTAGELLDVIASVRGLPLAAVDLTEVAPRYDPSGRTAQLAARALFELLFTAPAEVAG